MSQATLAAPYHNSNLFSGYYLDQRLAGLDACEHPLFSTGPTRSATRERRRLRWIPNKPNGGAVGQFYLSTRPNPAMDRQRILAIILVLLMLLSSLSYAIAAL